MIKIPDEYCPIYERKINRLVLSAGKEARGRVRKEGPPTTELRIGIGGTTYNHDFETQYFHEAMNRTAREAGLRP